MADGVASRFDKYTSGPNVGTPVYTAADERLLDAVLAHAGGDLLSRAGVRPGGGFAVSIGGSPEQVTLSPGLGIITDAGGGGSFPFAVPSAVAIDLPTRPSTGESRISELIGVILNDEVRPADGAREVDVQLLNGAPGTSPSAPAVPAGAIRFRRLTIPASGAPALTLPPQRIAAVGGIILVAGTTERDAISPLYDGVVVYREDNDTFEGRAEGAWALLGRKTHSCHVKRTTVLAGTGPDPLLANNGTTAIRFDTELRDTSGMWSSAAPTDVVIPVDGWYDLTGRVPLDNVAAGTFHVVVERNGTAEVVLHRGAANASPATPTMGRGTDRLFCNAGDILTLTVFHNTGAGRNVFAAEAYACELIVTLAA